MGVSLQLVSHDEELEKKGIDNVIILNTLDNSSSLQKEEINKLIFNVQGDVFSNIPTCDCGALQGGYNRGRKCDSCQTFVENKISNQLDVLVWMKSPMGVAPFMNPKAWTMLSGLFIMTNAQFPLMRYIADASYSHPRSDEAWHANLVNELHKHGILKRGWNYFYENFDHIMQVLLTAPAFRKTDKTYDDYQPYLKLIQKYRDKLFSNYLPLPNRSMLAIEQNETGMHRDKDIDVVIDVARIMTGIDLNPNRYSLRAKENRTAKIVAMLSDYYLGIDTKNAKKEGGWRKHVFSSRSNFSFRTVITSITEPHTYDELHLPWGIAVSMLRFHLVNKLMRLGWKPIRIENFLTRYAMEYNPLLAQLFRQLIDESPNKGLEVIFSRNPIMKIGSAQLKRITKVKEDVQDITVGMSILTVCPYNADSSRLIFTD